MYFKRKIINHPEQKIKYEVTHPRLEKVIPKLNFTTATGVKLHCDLDAFSVPPSQRLLSVLIYSDLPWLCKANFMYRNALPYF